MSVLIPSHTLYKATWSSTVTYRQGDIVLGTFSGVNALWIQTGQTSLNIAPAPTSTVGGWVLLINEIVADVQNPNVDNYKSNGNTMFWLNRVNGNLFNRNAILSSGHVFIEHQRGYFRQLGAIEASVPAFYCNTYTVGSTIEQNTLFTCINGNLHMAAIRHVVQSTIPGDYAWKVYLPVGTSSTGEITHYRGNLYYNLTGNSIVHHQELNSIPTNTAFYIPHVYSANSNYPAGIRFLQSSNNLLFRAMSTLSNVPIPLRNSKNPNGWVPIYTSLCNWSVGEYTYTYLTSTTSRRYVAYANVNGALSNVPTQYTSNVYGWIPIDNPTAPVPIGSYKYDMSLSNLRVWNGSNYIPPTWNSNQTYTPGESIPHTDGLTYITRNSLSNVTPGRNFTNINNWVPIYNPASNWSSGEFIYASNVYFRAGDNTSNELSNAPNIINTTGRGWIPMITSSLSNFQEGQHGFDSNSSNVDCFVRVNNELKWIDVWNNSNYNKGTVIAYQGRAFTSIKPLTSNIQPDLNIKNSLSQWIPVWRSNDTFNRQEYTAHNNKVYIAATQPSTEPPTNASNLSQWVQVFDSTSNATIPQNTFMFSSNSGAFYKTRSSLTMSNVISPENDNTENMWYLASIPITGIMGISRLKGMFLDRFVL
jgi:hypothetical protein